MIEIKIALTSFIIFMVFAFAHSTIGERNLPDKFYIIAGINMIVGVVALIVGAVHYIWM